jgi:hypothetical protein
MKAHRHTLGHEHDHEPEYGLPEALPAGEKLLWQGSPAWRALAVEVFHVRKLCIYFALLLTLRAGFIVGDGGGVAEVLSAWVWLLPMCALCIAAMLWLARQTARTTVYSITSKRVVMRIGIVLNVTYNLPFKRITAADVLKRADGHGDIPLTLAAGDRIAILQLWPHARPWRLRRPEPMLRCVGDVATVAGLLSKAWSEATGIPATPAPREPKADAAAPDWNQAPRAA